MSSSSGSGNDVAPPPTVVDNGLSLAEMFGSTSENDNYLPPSSASDPPPDSPVPDAVDGGGKSVYEVLVSDLAAPIRVLAGDAVEVTRGDAGRRTLRENIVAALGVEGSERVTIEQVNLGSSIFARVHIPIELYPPEGSSVAKGDELVQLRKDLGLDHLAMEVHRRRLSANNVDGKRTGFGGGLDFTPGAISFKGDNRPLAISAPSAVVDAYLQRQWEVAVGRRPAGRPVTVAILDTGIDPKAEAEHILFAGNRSDDPWGASPDHEVAPSGEVVDDVFGHGTFVAGIVSQRCPEAMINHESVRTKGGRTSDAFELARDIGDIAGSDIVVFSFATRAADESSVRALRAVVEHLLRQGVVVVAAAGGGADDSLGSFPADFKFEPSLPGRLIVVRAVDRHGEDLFSPKRSEETDEDVPIVRSYGVGVASAFPVGRFRVGEQSPLLSYPTGWCRWSGDSFACPRVAGAIADEYTHAGQDVSIADAADRVIERASGHPNKVVN